VLASIVSSIRGYGWRSILTSTTLIVRDRVQDLIGKVDHRPWTTDMCIEAVYRSLQGQKYRRFTIRMAFDGPCA